ncbi:MAG: NADH-quinone oxidoreductase subunit C/D [Sedimentisphaerales bacterium]
MVNNLNIADELKNRFGNEKIAEQKTRDDVPTVWVDKADVGGVLRYLKNQINEPYKMLYDLTAIDERPRKNKVLAFDNDFTVVYQLFSFGRNQYLRVKAPLKGENPSIGTITDLWPCANWYEREVWDMFGIKIEGHPHLARILMPDWWQGHPLRKEHPARATDMQDFTFGEKALIEQQRMLEFKPEDWGMKRHSQDSDFMFLNLGPHHPGTHGVLRIVLQLDDEEIIDAVPDIGYHHRGAEKMGERQSWHTYIPYTDRVDYLGGVMNNLAYLMAVEKLAGIEVPQRAQVIRVMMAELFRVASHLVWYGTFAQDLGALSPVFYMFTDREYLFDIVQAITGGRMHPNWFRIGGVAQDLPVGWDGMVRGFLDYMPARMREYDKLVMNNEILKARTKGVGVYTQDEAIEWGVTGPGLRACGLEWDFRKKTPYSGYENFDFEIPTGQNGDCYDRAVVRVEEIRQSLRIIRQCVDNMPAGPYKADHPLTTPPLKEHTMQDIETLIAHFLTVSWGPVMPEGEAFFGIEATKGNNGYYVISDGNTVSYRTRIRTPSFPHIQMLSKISKGGMVADLIAILGSIDFVLADVDR